MTIDATTRPEAVRPGTIYQPDLVVVDDIVDETPDTRTYRLRFKDAAKGESFTFRAGQFGEFSVFGSGESTFCIASPPTRSGYLECTFKAAGKVTGSLREVNVGDMLGFRGPYGNVLPGRRVGRQGPRLHRRRDRAGAGALRHLERARLARSLSAT